MRTVHVGFRTEGFAPFTALFKEIGAAKYDVDLQPAALFNREGAEEDLVGGEVGFLLGQHFTPVAATARGAFSLCWLTVPQVEHEFVVVTRPDIQDLQELKGRSVLLPEARCPALNSTLMLRKLGLEDQVKYLNSARGSNPERNAEGRAVHDHNWFLTAVKEGRADCVIGYPPLDLYANRMNLKVHEGTPTLDIVAGPLITTTPTFAHRDRELTLDILRAYLEAIHVFKTDRERVMAILLEDRDLLRRMGFEVDDKEVLDSWYKRADGLQARPYPTTAALEWTEYKAAVDCPEATASGLNAIRTFDLEFLLQLDREGFIDSVWSPHGA